MTREEKDERIRALRSDPDFRALVDCLTEQTAEQVESFIEYSERSDAGQERGFDHGEE